MIWIIDVSLIFYYFYLVLFVQLYYVLFNCGLLICHMFVSTFCLLVFVYLCNVCLTTHFLSFFYTHVCFAWFNFLTFLVMLCLIFTFMDLFSCLFFFLCTLIRTAEITAT